MAAWSMPVGQDGVPAGAGESVTWHQTLQRHRLILIAFLAGAATLALARLVYDYMFLPLAFVGGLGIVYFVIARPRGGLFLVFGLVAALESLADDPFMIAGDLLYSSLQSRFNISGAIVSLLELLLVLLLLGWLFRVVAGGEKPTMRPLSVHVFILAGFLVFGLLVGLLQGGDFNIALWESRYFFYVVVGYFITAHYVTTREHVQRLLSIFLVAVGIYGIEGTFRYFALIQTKILKLAPEFLYGHEVPIFLTGYLILVFSMFVLGAPKWQRTVGLLLLPVVLFTLLGSGRRAGQITLLISLVLMTLVWLFVHRKAFLMMSIPMLLIALVYFPLFWNNTGVLGQPARAVRSLTDPSSRDASSDNYRDLEAVNVIFTIQSAPVTGIGFGRPFNFVVALPDLSWWPFWHYEPHHNFLWIWMKMGIGGFLAFLALMSAALARSARIVRVNTLPEARVFGMLAIACLASTLIFSYVDLGMVNPRLTLLMGVILGGISRISDGDPLDRAAV